MQYLRTPDQAFTDIDFEFEPHYVTVSADDGTRLRMHYIDEGPSEGDVVLCLHGQPSWSYLYRKMVKPLVSAGLRVVAPDLIGFGKSDKPTDVSAYSYGGHVNWVSQFIDRLQLSGITGMFQDWGGLIGMRVFEAHPKRFARIVVANTMLLDSSDIPMETAQAIEDAYATLAVPSARDVKLALDAEDPLAGAKWVKYATENPHFSIADVFKEITGKTDETALRGYTAPYPDDRYLAGPRAFPQLFPIMARHQWEREENDRVWASLSQLNHPVLTAFSDGDPVTRGHDRNFRERLPGAQGVQHLTIPGAGHYLQDEQPELLARAIINFV